MTTAHRPTFHNAVGGDNQGGNFLVTKSEKVPARDLPGQLTLKSRKPQPVPLYSDGQPQLDLLSDSDGQLKREAYRNKLEERERQHQIKKAREISIRGPLEALTNISTTELINRPPSKLLPDQDENPFPEDSDDDGPLRRTNGSDSDENDDDEEEEALMRELEKIKRDRQEEEKKKSDERARQEAIEERERVLKANPLLLSDPSSDRIGLKRRWDDDVVFRNQTKDLPKPKKRFVNDTVRSEFHRKFLTKYIH